MSSWIHRNQNEKQIIYAYPIQNYIDFQTLRFDKNENIVYHSQFDSLAYSIAPMLLQPFVENCFTHSDLATNSDSFAHVSLEVKNGWLVFQTENSVSPSHSHHGHQKNSIGLDNVEQRLKLYYPDEHTLEMKEENQVYKVNLTLKLR